MLVYPGRIAWIPSDEVQAGPFRQVVLDDVALMERIWVKEDGRIEVQGGGDFAAITLTPGLALRPESLRKIRELVLAGATLIGEAPPGESSSLENWPECDREIADLIDELWSGEGSSELHELSYGKGRILATTELIEALDRITGGPDLQFIDESGKGHPDLFRKEPEYAPDESLLPQPGVQVNAITDKALESMDFTHRRDGEVDIYFVCNTGDDTLKLICDFRVDGREPEVWDPVTGQIKDSAIWKRQDGRTEVAMQFAPRQSLFVVFRIRTNRNSSETLGTSERFGKQTTSADIIKQLDGPWSVTFDQKWGGPAQVVVQDELEDWTKLNDKAINYYSGSALYQKSFDVSTVPSGVSYIDIGEVYNLARVTLNDRELGVIWTAPWRLQIPAGLLKEKSTEFTSLTKSNILKIEVANTWVNRLIGDEQEPEDCPLVEWSPANRKGSYDINVNSRGLKDLPDWLIHGDERPSKGRYTFTSWRFYDKNAPLSPSGLLGPVQLLSE